MARQELCRLDELPDQQGHGIEWQGLSLVLIRKGEQVFAYQNVCPHVGAPLNWMPDRFLTLDRAHILCATHGAQFEIDSGKCIFGPCQGQSLTPVGIEIEKGVIYLT